MCIYISIYMHTYIALAIPKTQVNLDLVCFVALHDGFAWCTCCEPCFIYKYIYIYRYVYTHTFTSFTEYPQVITAVALVLQAGVSTHAMRRIWHKILPALAAARLLPYSTLLPYSPPSLPSSTTPHRPPGISAVCLCALPYASVPYASVAYASVVACVVV